jgi:hypothetical protein
MIRSLWIQFPSSLSTDLVNGNRLQFDLPVPEIQKKSINIADGVDQIHGPAKCRTALYINIYIKYYFYYYYIINNNYY